MSISFNTAPVANKKKLCGFWHFCGTSRSFQEVSLNQEVVRVFARLCLNVSLTALNKFLLNDLKRYLPIRVSNILDLQHVHMFMFNPWIPVANTKPDNVLCEYVEVPKFV